MIEFSTKKLNNFIFLDAGCGNGWVVRKVSKLKNCTKAIGIDGSKKMIEKAKSLDYINKYYCENLLDWKPKKKMAHRRWIRTTWHLCHYRFEACTPAPRSSTMPIN